MDDRAPTHPIGAMLGDRGWTILEAVSIAGLASLIAFAETWLIHISWSWLGSIGQLAISVLPTSDLVVIGATGLIGAAVFAVDGHRPRVRWPDHDRALLVVGAIALLVVAAVSVGGAVISTFQRQSSAVFGVFGAPPLWQSISISLLGILGLCGRIVGEEVLFRTAVQRRLAAVSAVPVAIGVTAVLHALFAIVVNGRVGPAVLLLLVATILESGAAGLAYDRTAALGPAIVVRLVASTIVPMLGIVLTVVW